MSLKKLNIAVVGATGYVGLDLILLLTKHPKIKIKYLCAQKNIGKELSFFDKRIRQRLPKITSSSKVNWSEIDIVFLSLPNGEAQKLITKLVKFINLKYIDLSADFRLFNPNDYKIWYNTSHKAKNLIKDSIYSISEFTKEKIKNYKIVAKYIKDHRWLGWVGIGVIFIVALQLIVGGLDSLGIITINENFRSLFHV